MRGILSATLCFCSAAVVAPAQAPATQQKSPVAFTHVNVIPLDRERVLPDQTVLVSNGRIEKLGPADQVTLPARTTTIDGRGKYLIPGLFDMHAHLLSDGALPDSLAADELMVMLANGVTSARLMIGTPEQLMLRERVCKGEIAGPWLTVGSPQLSGRPFGEPFNGYVVTTPERAVAAVRAAKAAGYDFIKITFFISRPVFDAVVATAAEAGLPVVGHVDPQVGLARALEAHQEIEHLDGMLEALVKSDSPVRGSVSGVQVWQRRQWESLDHLDLTRIDSIAREVAKAGKPVTPTLTFLKLAFGVGQSDEEIQTRPDYSFLPPATRAEMALPRNRFWSDPPPESRRRMYVQARNELTRAILRAGGRIMAGSDAPDWFLTYGFTLHRELENLVEAGLTPYEALAAATRVPAEFLGVAEQRGTIQVGADADLVLLDSNPLQDIRQTTRRAGVMLRGRWWTQKQLDEALTRSSRRILGS